MRFIAPLFRIINYRPRLIILLSSLAITAISAQAAAPTIDGLWLTDGYREFIEARGDDLRIYEITNVSCIFADHYKRQPSEAYRDEVVFASGDDTLRISQEPSTGTLWLHDDGSVANVRLVRTRSRPRTCDRPTPDTPQMNYEVFERTFLENYPFFALRKVDWRAADKKFRPEVTPQTKPQELFRILANMIEPLHDVHTSLFAHSIQETFRGDRADQKRKPGISRIDDIIETNYLRGTLRDFCNQQIPFGMLRSGPGSSVGYLRIQTFVRYSEDSSFERQVDTLETALDELFRDAAAMTGLVIDVRINPGGSDVFGISIASRLTTKDYLAYSKVTRNNIGDSKRRTEAQPIMVPVSQRPGFHGPVILLTSESSHSAAETFAMALVGRQPRVIRVGENTQGVFSDVLVRRLPNGWLFGLPNEIYLTAGGKAFDAVGLPPDIEVPVFSTEDLAQGRDPAIDKAIQLLTGRDN